MTDYAKVRAILDAEAPDPWGVYGISHRLTPELLAAAEAAEALIGDDPPRRGDWVALRAALDALHAKMKETLT